MQFAKITPGRRVKSPRVLPLFPFFVRMSLQHACCLLVLASACCAQTRGTHARSADADPLGNIRLMIAQHHLKQAEAALEKFLKAQPDSPEALDDLGDVRMQQQQEGEAERLFRRAIAAGPGYAPGYADLGRVLESQQQSASAMEAYESALRLDANNETARAGEVRVSAALAIADRRVGDMEGALILLQRARNSVPDDATLLLDIGMQQDAMHLYKDAEATLAAAHTAYPADAKLIYALARVELDMQKLPAAEALFREYLKAKPDDASAHYGLGRLLHMAARNEEAAAELQRSAALQPRQTEAYYELGSIALDQQHGEQARTLFQKVLDGNPAHGGALTGMGILAFRAKSYADAERYLHDAVLQAYDYQPAHYYYGLTLARVGKTQQSEQELALATAMAEGQHAHPLPAGQIP